MKKTKKVLKALDDELRRKIKSRHPKKILAYAKRHKDSIWHSALEWDDRKAGDAWRVKQIQETLRIISVTVISPPESPVRVILPTYKSLPDRRGNGYEEISSVMDDSNRRTVLLKETIQRLRQIKEVMLFEELSDVRREIDLAADLYLNGGLTKGGKKGGKGKGGWAEAQIF